MAAARKPPALPPVRRNSAARNRQIARLQSRLGELWDELRIPSWHRVLFEEKYCRGEYGPDVLAREIRALRAGTALVQRVLEAINNRQEILVWLTLLRTGYDDTEFLTAGTLPRRHLSQQLQALRFASVSVVELLSAWRSFVAPRPGKHQLGFGGPVARGALWPHVGPRGDLEDEDEDCEDYLLHLARDDTVVRCFDTVLEVSPECDPLLLHGSIGGVGWKESGKLCPPPADAVQRARLERARLMLLEEEVALSTFASAPPTRSRESTSSTLPKTVYMESLTAPLRLPLPGAPATLLNDLISEWRDKLVSSQASLPIGDRPVLSAVLRSYSREENASQEPCGEGKLKRGGTPQPARPRRSHLGATRWRPQTR